MQWYYSKNGSQIGPVEEDDLRAKLGSGEISPSDLVWRDGMTDWLPAGKVPELGGAPAGPVAIPRANRGGTPVSPYAPPVRRDPAPISYGPQIPSYLWQSIVVTIICCWPFGIPAIVYAAKVDGLQTRGDILGAMEASKNAKMWCMISAGVFLVFGVLWLLAVVGGGALR